MTDTAQVEPTYQIGTGKMSAAEFIEIQNELGLSSDDAADFLRVHCKTINNWREGKCAVSGGVALAMRMLQSRPKELQFWKDTQKVTK